MPLQEADTIYTPDDLIAGDYPIQTDTVTILAGENRVRGDVLGRVTASKKHIHSLSAAVDGSQTPDAILVEDCDATAGDKQALVYLSGEFNDDKLGYGTGHDAASVKEAFRKGPIFIKSSLPNG